MKTTGIRMQRVVALLLLAGATGWSAGAQARGGRQAETTELKLEDGQPLVEVARRPPPEICDGLDNDGDGQIDEDFDVDGDGAVNCCDPRHFYATITPGGGGVDAWLWAGGGVFDHNPMAGVTGGNASLNAVGDFDQDGLLDIQWRDTVSNDHLITTCSLPTPTSAQGEWTTQVLPPFAFLNGAYPSGGDVDGDGCLDLVGIEHGNSPVTGSGDVYTAIGNCDGTFTELGVTGNAAGSLGTWVGRRVYSLEDMDGINGPDLVIHGYDTGGNGTTTVSFLPNTGGGFFGPAVPLAATPQIQNGADLGDIDGDGCSDWVGGGDDDGNRGEVWAALGDCAGGLSAAPAPLVDTCVGCPGGGAAHGAGSSRLFDWDQDGDQDLLSSHVVTTGATAQIDYWDNAGGIAGAPLSTPTTPADLAAPGFAVPLPTVELCDGIDNDLDGQIDEDFDVDGDGAVQCCDIGEFYATVQPGNTDIDAWFYDATNNNFTRDAGVAGSASGPVQLNAIADFINSDGILDILWRDSAANRFVTTCSLPVTGGTQGEWTTTATGSWANLAGNYSAGGDVDADGCMDLVGWQLSNGPVAGSGQGFTAFGDCNGGFTEVASFNVAGLVGQWVQARAYNLDDIDGDGNLDIMAWAYDNGGAATTRYFYLAGDGCGNFGPLTAIGGLANQPQNAGDTGDWDLDGCLDHVGGSDDDANRAASFGGPVCGATMPAPTLMVDQCAGACGTGAAAGSGAAQLYDWDADGFLDLLTSRVVNTGTSASIDYWHNLGGAWGAAPTVANQTAPNEMQQNWFVTPLRNTNATPCAPQDLLGVDWRGVLWDVDELTGAASNPRPTGIGEVIDVVWSPVNPGQAIILNLQGGGSSMVTHVDPVTGTPLSSCTVGIDIDEGDLAVHPTGRLYAAYELGSDTLIAIDPATCNWGPVGPLGGTFDISGLAFDPSGSILYGVDGQVGELYEIDPFSGAILNITPLNPPIVPSELIGLDWDVNTGELLMVNGNNFGVPNELFRVDPFTGAVTPVGPLGLPDGLTGIQQ